MDGDVSGQLPFPPSLREMREEAERELLRRKRDYPNKIATHRLHPVTAMRRTFVMQHIVQTLQDLEQRAATPTG